MSAATRRKIVFLCLFGLCRLGYGSELGGGSLAGLMQQPSSQYMLAVYGGYLEWSSSSRSLLARANYLERPKFSSQGFVDQEQGVFALIGSKLSSSSQHGITGYVGWGKMSGYIAVEENNSYDMPRAKRSFSMPGFSTALAYELRYAQVDLSVEHISFVGYGDDHQLEAFVGWPYNFFLARIGFYL